MRALDRFGRPVAYTDSFYGTEANITKSQAPLSPSMASRLTLASAPQSSTGFSCSMDKSIFTAVDVSVTVKDFPAREVH